jgi:hypothetical protein
LCSNNNTASPIDDSGSAVDPDFSISTTKLAPSLELRRNDHFSACVDISKLPADPDGREAFAEHLGFFEVEGDDNGTVWDGIREEPASASTFDIAAKPIAATASRQYCQVACLHECAKP